MKAYEYIIIGGGMTGAAAIKGIRSNDPLGAIAVFSQEAYPPYDRPPLTKGLWEGKDVVKVFKSIEDDNVDLFLNTTVVKITPDKHQITTDKGDDFSYQKLLLATGGEPRQLPGEPEGVIYYRTLADYDHLHNLTSHKNNFCVIGGGFIGSEIAAALNKNNKQVTMIFPENGISSGIFPDDLSIFLNGFYRQKGVAVLNDHLVDSVTKKGEFYSIELHNQSDGQVSQLQFDGVIAGISIKPSIALAMEAGISVEDGILVDEFLQTNLPDVYAAGDVANFFNYALNKRSRVEHEDNANTMGKTAGVNMSGGKQKYDHLPFFYSDLFAHGYEAVGEHDKNDEVFEDWIDPFQKGTIYYLRNGKIRGLIFWNLWGKVDEGRKLIKAGKTYKEKDLRGLFS